MRRLYVLAAAVLLSFSSIIWCSCQKADVTSETADVMGGQSTFAAIKGTVVNVDNSEPIGNVLLSLYPGGLNTYADSVGAFMFEELEALQYTLIVQKSGYITNRNIVNTTAGETTSVTMMLQRQ